MSNINFEHVGRSVRPSVRRSVTRLLSVRHTFVFLSKICIWLARRASHMLAYDTYGWPEGPAITRDSYLGRRPSLFFCSYNPDMICSFCYTMFFCISAQIVCNVRSVLGPWGFMVVSYIRPAYVNIPVRHLYYT